MILSGAALFSLAVMAWATQPAAAPAKKAAVKPAATSAVKKAPVAATAIPKAAHTTAPAAKSATAAAASKGGTKTGAATRSAAVRKAPAKKGPPAPRTTWRNRQAVPTPDRYKEIQNALVAKGYLPPDAANGNWDQASADALKKFQADQNVETTGKINSLSLIALGLGPRRDSAAAKAQDVQVADFTGRR